MYIGGYTQAHLTLWVRRMVGSGGNVTTQEVGTGTYLILFILVILQSLVNSLISIARKREREGEKARETEKCVMSVMLLTIKIRQPVWWHIYSKIMVCLLL